MSMRALDRKKREREDAQPTIDAFAAKVNLQNPVELSAYLFTFRGGSSSSDGIGGDHPATAADGDAPQQPNLLVFEDLQRLCAAHDVPVADLKRLMCQFCPRAVLDTAPSTTSATTTAAITATNALPNDGESDLPATSADAKPARGAGHAYHPERSYASPWACSVGDLCFVLQGAAAPTDVKERRKAEGDADWSALAAATGDDAPPLLRHYHTLLDQHWPSEKAAFFSTVAEPLPMALRVHRCEPALAAVARHYLGDSSTALPPARPIPSDETSNGTTTSPATGASLCDVVKPVSWLASTPATAASSGGPYVCEAFQSSHAAYHADGAIEHACKTLHSAGAVSFQELVSVLPVLALDIRSEHWVLDMCAAPGSKTLLAVDAAMADSEEKHRKQQQNNNNTSSSNTQKGAPLGVIWANEKDHVKATQSLPSRLKRHHAPNVIASKCDATQLPLLFRKEGSGSGGAASLSQSPASDGGCEGVRFDRIICDVPCSGDGTVRKERSLIGSWNSRYVDSLVPTQKRLLRRGLESLKEGGVIAYSTCSLNPAEDEEVVYDVLKNYAPGSIEIMCVREALATTYAGRVPLDTFPNSFGVTVVDDATSAQDPRYRGCRDVDVKALAAEIAAKSLRVLPHTQNTGGFFVCLLKKKQHPLNLTLPTVVSNKLNNWTGHKRWTSAGDSSSSVDSHWQHILDYYGIDLASPNAAALAALVPVAFMPPDGKGPVRRIQLLSPGVAEFLTRVHPYKGPGVDIVLFGMRAFEIYDGSFLADARCRWRCVMEAASLIAEAATKRKIVLEVPPHPLDNNSTENAASTTRDVVRQLLRDGSHTFVVQQQPTSAEDGGQQQGGCAGWIPSALTEALRPLILSSQPVATPQNNLPMNTTPLLDVGPVLVGLHSPALPTVWWFSANLTGRRIEITADISVRSLALLAFLNERLDK